MKIDVLIRDDKNEITHAVLDIGEWLVMINGYAYFLLYRDNAYVNQDCTLDCPLSDSKLFNFLYSEHDFEEWKEIQKILTERLDSNTKRRYIDWCNKKTSKE